MLGTVMEFKRWWASPTARDLRWGGTTDRQEIARIAFEAGQEVYKRSFETAYKLADKKDLELRRQRIRIIELINEVAELQKKLDGNG